MQHETLTFTKNSGEIVSVEYARKRVWTKLRSDWGPKSYGRTVEQLRSVMARTFDNHDWLRGRNGMTVMGVYESVNRNLLYKGVA